MNEIIQSLIQKTGIDPQTAQTAVNHVLDFIKSKLPPSLSPHIDNAASGNTVSGDMLQNIESKISGMFK